MTPPRQPSLSPGCHEEGALAGTVAPWRDRDTALPQPVPPQVSNAPRGEAEVDEV